MCRDDRLSQQNPIELKKEREIRGLAHNQQGLGRAVPKDETR